MMIKRELHQLIERRLTQYPAVALLGPRQVGKSFVRQISQPGSRRGRAGMTKARRFPDYLGHILRAIERIDRYSSDMDEVGFLNSELVQDAVIRNLEIIGEAANNIQCIAPKFAARHCDIPWQITCRRLARTAGSPDAGGADHGHGAAHRRTLD